MPYTLIIIGKRNKWNDVARQFSEQYPAVASDSLKLVRITNSRIYLSARSKDDGGHEYKVSMPRDEPAIPLETYLRQRMASGSTVYFAVVGEIFSPTPISSDDHIVVYLRSLGWFDLDIHAPISQ